MGDLDSKPGQQAQTLLDKTLKWNDSWYDCSIDEIKNKISANSSNGIIYVEYSYIQIGRTNEWLKYMSDKIGDPLTVRREILLQRLHGSSLSPYPREDIEYIISTMHKPIGSIEVLDFYTINLYDELDKSIPYIVGVDCSTGTSSDNNAITIINPYTAIPVADFKSPYIGETAYEDLIEELVIKYISRAVVVIERNSIGDGIIDHLLNESKIASRLYFDKDKDLLQEKMRHAETIESMLAVKSKEKTFYGVYTEGHSREVMFSILSRRISEYKDDFVTENIIKDISGLVKTSSGKIVAGPASYDDSIMSYLIGMYVYYHGNNLEYFGIYHNSDYADGLGSFNNGLIRPTDLSDILPQDVINKMERDEESNKKLDYEEIMREAILQSQNDSKNLSKSRFMSSDNIYDNSLSQYRDDDDFNEYSDLSFFNDMNGM